MLQGCSAVWLLRCRALSHRVTFRVTGAAVVALCCRAAVCSAAALQGRCTAAPLHCRSGVQQGRHGVNDTPAQAKKGEVNANVNSIILKSLPKFG